MRFADICESSYGGKTKTLEITLEISEPPVGIRMLIHLVWIIPGFVLLFSKTKEKHSAFLNGITEVVWEPAKKGRGGRDGSKGNGKERGQTHSTAFPKRVYSVDVGSFLYEGDLN